MWSGAYMEDKNTVLAVKSNAVKTDTRKVFVTDRIKNGKVSFQSCLITPFADKKFCFKDWLRGIKNLPTKEMAIIVYDNSNSIKFRKLLKSELLKLFNHQIWIKDENTHYTVENSSEYNLINRRTWEIYSSCIKYIPKSEYVFIVEDDVEVPSGTYEKFVNLMNLYPQMGTVVGNTLNRRFTNNPDYEKSPIVWNIVEEKVYPSKEVISTTHQLKESKSFGLEAVGAAHTGCWFTRTALIKKLGFVWKENGINFVDQTWGYRLNKAGYFIAVDWSVKCKHYSSINGKKSYV